MNKEKEKHKSLSYQCKMLITNHVTNVTFNDHWKVLSNENKLKVGPNKFSFESTFKAMKFYGTKYFKNIYIQANICVQVFVKYMLCHV
jgi:hypothetical protein